MMVGITFEANTHSRRESLEFGIPVVKHAQRCYDHYWSLNVARLKMSNKANRLNRLMRELLTKSSLGHK